MTCVTLHINLTLSCYLPSPPSLCPFHAPAEYSQGNHTKVSLFEDIFKFCSRVRTTLLHSCLESLVWLYTCKRGSSRFSPQSVSTCDPGVVKIIGQQLWQDFRTSVSITQGMFCTSVFTLECEHAPSLIVLVLYDEMMFAEMRDTRNQKPLQGNIY